MHCGTINYFKNKTGLYHEFTMIGKPLTELFRLESVSIDERINYYEKHKLSQRRGLILFLVIFDYFQGVLLTGCFLC